MLFNRRESDRIEVNRLIFDTYKNFYLVRTELEKIRSKVIPIRCRKGEIITEENISATHSYILASGTADVFHCEDGENPVHVATLTQGDSFGEEGLIIGNHTSTVIMKEKGVVFSIAKYDFLEKLYYPLTKEVDVTTAKKLSQQGWLYLDIRCDFEIEIFGSIDNSIHIPMHKLRTRLTELDRKKKYIAYCKSGNRSQAATLFLSQAGFQSYSMSGGFTDWEMLENTKMGMETKNNSLTITPTITPAKEDEKNYFIYAGINEYSMSIL